MTHVPQPDENIQGELSREDRDNLIDELAQRIVRRGMETPAIMFLEMHKPVSFLASQSLLVAGPFLAPLFGMEGVERYSMLLNSVDNVELLIRRIEDLSEEKDRVKTEEKSSVNSDQ